MHIGDYTSNAQHLPWTLPHAQQMLALCLNIMKSLLALNSHISYIDELQTATNCMNFTWAN